MFYLRKDGNDTAYPSLRALLRKNYPELGTRDLSNLYHRVWYKIRRHKECLLSPGVWVLSFDNSSFSVLNLLAQCQNDLSAVALLLGNEYEQAAKSIEAVSEKLQQCQELIKNPNT